MCAPSASQLDLSENTIGDDAGAARAAADAAAARADGYDYDSDGDEHSEGVQAIAGALRVNGALTKCDLRGNDMGEDGNASIRNAVQGKTGFMLHL